MNERLANRPEVVAALLERGCDPTFDPANLVLAEDGSVLDNENNEVLEPVQFEVGTEFVLGLRRTGEFRD